MVCLHQIIKADGRNLIGTEPVVGYNLQINGPIHICFVYFKSHMQVLIMNLLIVQSVLISRFPVHDVR